MISGVSGQGLDWLYSFMSQANNLGYRVDFIPIHWYKCGQTPSQLLSYLTSVYQTTGRPIWLTEFNYGANWCDNPNATPPTLPPTPSQEASEVSQFLSVLENAPFVERYSIFNWVTTNRAMVLDDGTLTPAGVIYVNQQSAMAYTQTLPASGSRNIAQFIGAVQPFEGQISVAAQRVNSRNLGRRVVRRKFLQLGERGIGIGVSA